MSLPTTKALAPPKHKFSIREATTQDLDDLTEIHIAGFTQEPYDNYCYPYRHKYPEEYHKRTREEYSLYLQQPEKYTVFVLEAQLEQDTAKKIVGLAVWNLAVVTSALSNPEMSKRQDANPEHLKAFRANSSQRFQTHFAKFEEKQVNLATLGVHLDFRRGGGGTMLMKWGMNLAEEKYWPVTLAASPIGLFLYEHLGFKKIGDEISQVEGEEEKLVCFMMVKRGEK